MSDGLPVVEQVEAANTELAALFQVDAVQQLARFVKVTMPCGCCFEIVRMDEFGLIDLGRHKPE